MEMIKDSLTWFEIAVSDFQRAKKFYSAIYDYEMHESMMGDTLMGFLPCDFEKGGIGGAICYHDFYTPSHDGAVVYLNGGEDLTVVLYRVEAAGGKIISPKNHVNPEIGFIAFFEDTEGNRIGLHSRS